MPYPQSAAESAELLRLVLPRIAKHGGHYGPVAYAVWYEHLAGLNKPLSEELDSRLQASEVIDQPDIEQLYQRYLSVRESRSALVLQDGLGDLLRKLGEIAGTSANDTAEYAHVLVACEQELAASSDASGLPRVIKLLVESTAAARSTTDKVQAELAASRAEMMKLRADLGDLQTEALTDPLTGLHNRRGFEFTLSKLCEEGSDGLPSAALLLMDIDRFKSINDTYGHLVGDRVIVATAKVLKDAVKGRDVVARFGGDEFMVLLPDTPGHGALALAEQIRSAFGKLRIRRSGSEEVIVQISMSIGVVTLLAGKSVEQAIDSADKALYQAKNEGRNCVRIAANAAAV